jgi:NAD(P)-dependent dehydrogenase (short-subunit alcohol dehydrogenase family)
MMADAVTRSVLITGASAGIGKELARQLAMRPEIERVVLACRDRGRAHSARADLETATGREIFDVVILDTADPGSTRSAARSLAEPIDALVMNAGGTGGPHPAHRTVSGATQVFAVNVLGHVALLETLIDAGKLGKAAVLTGSEAARGVPQFRIRRPSFAHATVDELASVIDGTYYAGRAFDASDAYGQSKYLGALWIGALARQHPELRLVTMSPGGTAGTAAAKTMPAVQRFAFDHIVMGRVGRLLGLSHSLRTGTARLALAVTDPAYRDGVFYASRARALTGPVVDQATILPDFAHPACQNNADEAVHRFLDRSSR